MKRHIKIAVLSGAIITIIVVVLAVFFISPKITGGKRISIEDVSLSWAYNEIFKYYYGQKVTIRFKNVGGTEISGIDLWIIGQINAQDALTDVYPIEFTMSGGYSGDEPLKPGQVRTVSHPLVGLAIKQSGTYTLTLRVWGQPPYESAEVLGERTMTISVP